MGSLTCGTLLVQRGWRVVILTETQPAEVYTFSWNGWCFDRWPEFFWGLEEGGVLYRVFASLGCQLEAIRLHPGVQALLPGHRVGFYPPGPEWERELRREFPRSAQPLIACLEQLSQIHRVTRSKMEAHLLGKRSWRPSPMIGREPLGRFLPRFDLDPALCRMVAVLTAACFSVEPEATTVAMAAALFGHIHHGLFVLRGGIGGLVAQLSSRFRALGGEMRPGRPQEIRTGWRRVQGVKTLEEEELHCHHLVVEPGWTSVHPGLYLRLDEAFIPGEMGRNVLILEPRSEGADLQAILQLTVTDGGGFPQASEERRAVTIKLLHAPPEDPLIFLERFFPGWSRAEVTFAPPPLSSGISYSLSGRWLRPVNLTILSHQCPLGTGVAASILQGYQAALRLSSRSFTAG